MDRLEKRLTVWWLVLAGVTFVSFETGLSAQGVAAQLAVVAVFVLAFSKTWIVIREFMDVRSAPLPLQLALGAWVLIVCLGLTGLWLSA